MKTYWVQFLRWLDGKESAKEEKIRVSFPTGNTDILLSGNQRSTLENAINSPREHETTSIYARETGFWKRSSSGVARKDDLII